MRNNRFYIICLFALGLLLTVSEGYLSLNRDGTPIHIYPCPVSSLPPKDQQLLSNGIPIKSISQLTECLEDYLS